MGSKQFGMCYHNDSGMASIGTILRIDTHVHLPDGRLFVVNQGESRLSRPSCRQRAIQLFPQLLSVPSHSCNMLLPALLGSSTVLQQGCCLQKLAFSMALCQLSGIDNVEHQKSLNCLWQPVKCGVGSLCAGMERFRVLKVLQQKPVLMCLVEILDDEEDGPAEVRRTPLSDASARACSRLPGFGNA